MMSVAAKVLLLFDAGKMVRTSFACFPPLETIDTIVADAPSTCPGSPGQRSGRQGRARIASVAAVIGDKTPDQFMDEQNWR